MQTPSRRRSDRRSRNRDEAVASVIPTLVGATLPSFGEAVATDPTEDQIARRAYELYEQRGGEHGYDLDDWLQAERELREPVKARTSTFAYATA
jgi:hypothetical protein